MELYIILSLLSSRAFKQYHSFLGDRFRSEESEELSSIYSTLSDFYSRNPDEDVGSVDNLEQLFHAAYPSLPKKKRELYSPIFDRLRSLTLNPETIEEYFVALQRKWDHREMAQEALLISQGKGNEERLKEIYGRLARNPDGAAGRRSHLWNRRLDVTRDFEDKKVAGGGLRFRTRTLQTSLGPIRRGDFGIVFARPEVGKTGFAVDCAAYMVPQVETCALYVANEERGGAVYSRIIQSYSGIPKKALTREMAIEIDEEIFRPKLIFIHEPGIKWRDLYALMQEAKPELIIIDQLDKIKGFEDDRKDLELGATYEWGRQVAAEFGPVIALSQASESGEGKRWLEQTDMANSKTAKAGEGDWILGIGKTHGDGMQNIRHFHLVKNKLDGDENTLEEYRHGKFDMLILPEISRYDDTGNRK